MIFNRLEEASRLYNLHSGFAKAFEFLKQDGLATLPIGSYEINGEQVYAMVQQGVGKGPASARLETHKKYIDIQFTLTGLELIGCGHARWHQPDSQGWDYARDICFLTGTPDFWLLVPEGSFAIFYPEEDLHAPMCGNEAVRKIVVKVSA
ncbi:MAG: YhcH/YjgK/YiaL family protein [Verrucomicrobiales bacterium]|jgi:YhcH/YjgK/YiaL family protein|nr:YhcH/YjgK/YiaL family protein [Verrucomicrobiales bacterium]